MLLKIILEKNKFFSLMERFVVSKDQQKHLLKKCLAFFDLLLVDSYWLPNKSMDKRRSSLFY
jgi:hypothetical protein